MNRFTAILVLLSMSMLGGCISPTTSRGVVIAPPQTIKSAIRFRKEYVLAQGDQLEIFVRQTPEVSRMVTIRPDGFISLPLLDDVKAAGLSPQELDAELTQRFATRLLNPEVTVIANQVREPVVYVVGDVSNPIAVPLREAPTAMQAVALAGVFRRSAAKRHISIIRLREDGYLTATEIPVDAGGQPGPYMALRLTLLRADDMIFVPESGRGQFSRGIEDFINRPISGVNSLLFTYTNFLLIEELDQTN